MRAFKRYLLLSPQRFLNFFRNLFLIEISQPFGSPAQIAETAQGDPEESLVLTPTSGAWAQSKGQSKFS